MKTNSTPTSLTASSSTTAKRPLRCIYVTYDGLLDPLGQSQVLPYVRRLIAEGHSFTIISYEKPRPAEEIEHLAQELAALGVQWRWLSFRSGKLEFVRRVWGGICLLRRTCRETRPDLIHLRGHMSAVMCVLAHTGVPHIYDFRSFAIEEWTDFGKLRSGSLPYRILRAIDRRAIKSACGLVVLEKPAEVLLHETYEVPAVPLKVIRTCTDVAVYPPRVAPPGSGPILRFVWLGGARRPYRPDLALRLVEQFRRNGYDCRLDFINERDHDAIRAALAETGFPSGLANIRRVAHPEVPAALVDYDCGLIFYDTSRWRRVCSPTKLGEYLAAGMPVVALEGVDTLDQFGRETDCVHILRNDEMHRDFSAARLSEIVNFIRQDGVSAKCRDMAARDFSLTGAGKLYAALYTEIGARL